MVDAIAIGLKGHNLRVSATGVTAQIPSFNATVHATAENYLAQCAELDLCGPAQSALWISAWLETTCPNAILVTVDFGGRPVFGMALQAQRRQSFTVAHVLGLSHANGNFFPLSSTLDPEHDQACLEAAIAAVRAARPDVHALVFERQLESLRGRKNPVLTKPSQISPNVALSVDLTPGFEAVLDIGNGQRKRKRHRYQTRKLEAFGEIRRWRPNTADEAAQVINAFLDMKAARMRMMGMPDVFGPEPVRAFFRTLFSKAAENPQPAFILDALEVDGKIRAVTGSSIIGDRLICDFAGFADDETATASPGEFLLFENIREAASNEFGVYDLGVGDEPYKRSWCDIETNHRDVVVAMTLVGTGLVAAQRAKTRIKALIKGNATLWPMVKAFRAKLKRAAG